MPDALTSEPSCCLASSRTHAHQWLRFGSQLVFRPTFVLTSNHDVANPPARTFPASGKFTSAQRDLYSAVLNAQKQLIELCTEVTSLELTQLHRHSCELLRTELAQLGFRLQTGDLEGVLYPHFLSHPIGIGEHISLVALSGANG